MDDSAWTIAAIFMAGLAGFASGRLRHDLVAILMLLAAVALGLVAPTQAFAGFGDPVVVTVGCVMVLSAAVARAGVLKVALTPFRGVLSTERGIVVLFCMLCAIASAFINNIGALALLLPAALSACRAAAVSPSRILMPMAFASLLGGLSTVIGTPPNLIISDIRANLGGAPFSMFDFAPVGAGVALIAIVAMVLSRKLIPVRLAAGAEPLSFKVIDYLFELRVGDKEREAPLTVGDVRNLVEGQDRISVHAIDRDGIIYVAPADWRSLLPGDIIQTEGRAPVIATASEKLGLEVVAEEVAKGLEAATFECVVPDRTPLVYAETPRRTLSAAGAALLAVSRSGRAVTRRLDELRLQPGDVLLLQASNNSKQGIIESFRLLPLAERPLEFGGGKPDWRAPAVLAAAVVAATTGIAPLAVALLTGIAALALLGRVTGRVYADIDWSILLLLGCLIPVAESFSELGAGDGIAAWISGLTSGASPVLVIGVMLATTMAVTPFLNNAAAVLIMAPIAAQVGTHTNVPLDAMLMAVAVGASCDFLTPIGHQSNTLVMGPGGYRFLDYTRFGAPVSVLVLIVGSLLIQLVWGGAASG
ncbi:MAG: SLC13 family permease [Hyphomonadaceae bacterium]